MEEGKAYLNLILIFSNEFNELNISVTPTPALVRKIKT
jgi:hypothetical protein